MSETSKIQHSAKDYRILPYMSIHRPYKEVYGIVFGSLLRCSCNGDVYLCRLHRDRTFQIQQRNLAPHLCGIVSEIQ